MGEVANPYAPSSELHALAEIYNVHGPDFRGDCFGELAYQLGILFGMMIIVNNLIEILGPLVGKCLQDRKQRVRTKGETWSRSFVH